MKIYYEKEILIYKFTVLVFGREVFLISRGSCGLVEFIIYIWKLIRIFIIS